ncbi:nitrite reductase small subunit NirD [Piscinibacter sakaiensis]|uniref:nitrite reductase small subunit NirD n=1 Tax=Piscinibacter sakaiensis TaxID=1547922 RepID=UPI003AADCBF4
MNNDWKRVCRVDDIPVLGSRRVDRAAAIPVAVFRNAEDKVFALLDRCPHKGGPLSQGIVFGESVACPLHNWTIGLDDGCARGEDVGCTQKFVCKVEAGEVFLDRHELATLALDVKPPKAGPGASTGALGDQSFDVQAPHTA